MWVCGTVDENYGSILTERRRRAGLTQRALADLIGIDQSTIASIEKDRRKPSLSVLQRWLEACGARIRIVGDEDELAALIVAASRLDGERRAILARFVEVLGALPVENAEREVRILAMRAGVVPMPELPALVSDASALARRRGA